MLIIFDNPDVLKRNDQGELVINGVAEQNTNFNALFSSMVGQVYDQQQPGIDKFLGTLRQIGVKDNGLRGQSLQRMYSSTPAQYGFMRGHQDLRNTSLSSSMRP